MSQVKKKKYDEAYRLLFDYPGMVRQLLESFILMPWVKKIDYRCLEKVNASFVRKNYRKKESDVIYRLFFEDQTAYLYLLIEFQSSVDPHMPFRIQGYVNDFYESLIKKEKKDRYPIIFPVVIYNGEEAWNVPDNIREKIEVPRDPALIPYIPSLKYFKIIVNEFKKQSLLQIRNSLASIFLMESLKEEEMQPYFKKIAEIIAAEVDPEIKQAFSNWLLRLLDQDFIPESEELINSSEEEVKTMLTATLKKMEKRFIEDGIKIGEKQGVKQGIKQGGYKKAVETAKNLYAMGLSIEQIAKAVGLSEKEIKEKLEK